MTIDLPPMYETENCLNASYYSFQNGKVSKNDKSLVLIDKSIRDEIATRIFVFKSKEGKIIISFEGTGVENELYDKNANRMNEITKMGLIPPSYRYALSFTKDYVQKNKLDKNNVLLTGFSAGSGQAEYVSYNTNLSGIVFAGTGIPGKIKKVNNFWNFVGDRDPVASFSSDTDFVFNNINLTHYGNVIYLGLPYKTYGTFGNIFYGLFFKKGNYLFFHSQSIYMANIEKFYKNQKK